MALSDSMEISRALLRERRTVWESKPILKKLYARWYGRIGEALAPGRTLELGGGSGNLKEFFPECIGTDIVFSSWLDTVLDAQELPFIGQSFDNIVLFDVLHHLSAPVRFFMEAQRILKPGGRVILMEPYVSPFSYVAYRFFHQEGLDREVDPLGPQPKDQSKDPFAGNQAVPSLIFEKQRKQFEILFPDFQIVNMQKTDFIAYPLSGGFHGANLHPLFLWAFTERVEKWLQPLASCLAFRMFIVLEKYSV
ncbi:MAG: class I SAM-dependent methyltransferase [Desulfobacteraceae bacterium]|nr:MAG: class I SAM-dependent methyltransferase [Desulfobacteraceae bacterium]